MTESCLALDFIVKDNYSKEYHLYGRKDAYATRSPEVH